MALQDRDTTQQTGQLVFEKAGPLTLIQDSGRQGGQQLGFAPSGAADQYAYHWANRLLNNPENTPAFEITLGPVTITFSAPTRIAITGAQTETTVNGRPVYPWSAARVAEGDRLMIKPPKTGLRTYVAIYGGFATPKIFNSSACTPGEPLPPPFNQAIQAGDAFQFVPPAPEKLQQRNLMAPFNAQVNYAGELLLSVTPAYQFTQFSEAAIRTFFTEIFTVSQLCDRMGYRLTGPALEFPGSLDWSEGIALGSIQIPPNGQPIVLLRDRQTIGGYPKIGTITAQGCDALSQRRPGQTVRFALQT